MEIIGTEHFAYLTADGKVHPASEGEPTPSAPKKQEQVVPSKPGPTENSKNQIPAPTEASGAAPPPPPPPAVTQTRQPIKAPKLRKLWPSDHWGIVMEIQVI